MHYDFIRQVHDQLMYVSGNAVTCKSKDCLLITHYAFRVRLVVFLGYSFVSDRVVLCEFMRTAQRLYFEIVLGQFARPVRCGECGIQYPISVVLRWCPMYD